MKSSASVITYLEKLILEGEELLTKQFTNETSSFSVEHYVPIEEYQRWRGNCRVLLTKLGKAVDPWKDAIMENVPNYLVSSMALLGVVRSIKDAVEGDHLISFADLVVAEAFSDLLDQANYLFSKGFWLASGVLARAVLEEELRILARKNNCLPKKERPTLGDLNAALYKNEVYNKLEFKLIENLAAIGNECAHNKPGVTEENCKNLLDQLVGLLPRLR